MPRKTPLAKEAPHEQRKKDTARAMRDPQPGDRFTEMYSYWVHVIMCQGDMLLTWETVDGFKLETVKSFRKRHRYDSIKGYWVTLVDRGKDYASTLDFNPRP